MNRFITNDLPIDIDTNEIANNENINNKILRSQFVRFSNHFILVERSSCDSTVVHKEPEPTPFILRCVQVFTY